MVLRPLGRTGLAVSPIGFGAFKIGRNQGVKYARGYDLPSEEQAGRLLNEVLDLGINLIDTAPAYGLSEERIGRSLAGRRGEFVLCTKIGETFESGVSRYDFSEQSILASVERSLKRLGTSFVDILLIHAPAEDVRVLIDTPAVSLLREFKSRGLARLIGFSGKTVDAAALALEWADVLMVEYHPLDTSLDLVMRQAAAAGRGVLVKKGLASGQLPAAEALPFVLRHAAVSSVVVGGLSIEHMHENVRIASGE